MQNFTFGREGTNWFLFAFVLLIGTLPSFGQCPEAGDFPATQDLCYLSTIDDLDTDGNLVFQTNREGDTQPIPGDELLTDEAIYYIGSAECAPGDRLPLEVDIDSALRPVNLITNSRTQGFEFTTCASENFNASDLASLFEAEPGTDYEIRVYDSEFGDTPYTGVLNEGGSYFVGQIDTENPGCPSLRTAVGFNPNQIEGPNAQAEQAFCEEATVADLVAEGTYDDTRAIRWYRSQTANSPLSAATQLIDGEIYFAAQVVNERGSVTPPCETPSGVRTPVTITLNEPLILEDQIGVVCENDVQETFPDEEAIENFYIDLLGGELDPNGTFDPTIEEVIEEYANSNGIGDFTTVYTVGNDECEAQAELTIRITETEEANAGSNQSVSLCNAEGEQNLFDFLSEDANTDGVFEGYENGIFDPSQEGEGIFEITYTVSEEEACVTGSASALITITVNEGDANAGDNQTGLVCETDVQLTFPDEEAVRDYYLDLLDENISREGTFTPSIEEVIETYQADEDGLGDFPTTYTVGEGECEDSAILTITITEAEEANAGSNQEVTFCNANGEQNLYDLLSDDANLDGAFEAPYEDGFFNPSEEGNGTYEVTYVVSDENACVTGTSSIVISIEVNQGSEEDVNIDICTAEFEGSDQSEILSELINRFSTYFEEEPSLEDFEPSLFEAFATLDPNNPAGEYEVSYTGNTCEVTNFFINISEGGEFDAGNENTGVVCAADVQSTFPDEEAIREYYLDLLDDGISREGTFEPSIEEVINTYQADEDGLGNFPTTYTVGNEECGDSVALTISIVEDVDAGENGSITLNEDDAPVNLFDFLEGTPDEGGTWSSGNGTFDPAINEPGDYTYTIGTESCEDSATVSVSVTTDPTDPTDPECPNLAGNEAIGVVCAADVQLTFPDEEAIREYYLGLLDENVSREGTFEPSIEEVINTYQADEDGLGDFPTTYSVENEECEDSVELTIRIVEDVDAGENGSITLNEDDAPVNLFDFLEGTPDEGGTWSSGNGTFDPAINEPGDYTYTIGTESCEDSAIVSVSVTTEPIEPECPNLAGDDAIGVVCETEVQSTFPDEEATRDFYLDLLDEGVSREGTFEPSIEEVINTYQADEDGLGDFATTYSVENEECEDSVELTIRIIETEEADAGEIDDQIVCSNEGMIDLSDYLEGSGAVEGGTFDGEGVDAGMFDSSIGSNEDGYTITYTVSEDNDACVTGEDSSTFVIEVLDAPNAGIDVEETYCITEVDEMLENPQDAIDWFTDFIDDEDIDQNGNFDPAIETLALQIIQYIDNPTEPSATFETNYSVSNGNCEDSATITLTINNLEVAEAGEFSDLTFCTTDEDQDLNDYLSDDATRGGTFSIDGQELENGIFQTSMMDADLYELTYSIDESIECIEGEDSITFVIEVIEGPNVGEDKYTTLCNSQIQAGLFRGSPELLTEFYLDLLDEDVSRDGEFTPNLQEFIDRYNSGDEIGLYTATYTLTNENCEASVELTLEVIEGELAETGDIADQTVCSSDADIDLFSYLSEDAVSNGTFEGYEDGMFSPSMLGAGTYDITYTVNEDAPCVEGEASTTFTITVDQGANAGEDMDVSVCNNDDLQDLYSLISADADMDGEFTLDGDLIEDGIMDPSQFEAGTYEVIYNVTAEEDECGGDDTAAITITLGEAPEAPTTGNAVAFCAIDGETANRLEAEGTNLTWYSDEALSMEVSQEDVLVDGDYYVTQSSDEGCESEAAVLTVNIVDSPAPTIASEYELCEYDNPTISDLTSEINETGEVTWYDSADGMTALSNNTTLTNGGTYFATLISDNGCESSERLEVTVTLEECNIIPEAITPNGDRINDTFSIGFLENEYPNFNVTVFNRWGNAIYKGNASTPEWDGTSNQSGSLGDDVLPVGVYFYVIDFNDGSTEPRQGRVYLNR